jgi:predicted ribosome quality control (RQC) complex YloA/Tae2 family protein
LPSAHMIVFKDKSRALSEDEIKKASIWLLSEVSSNTNDLKGQLFEVLMTECRHVKPIKGDKVGRVNYTHEQIYRLRL